MKVRVVIKQTVEYMADVEMSQSELDNWDQQLRDAGMYNQSDIAEKIIEQYGYDTGMKLGDPNDWGDMTVETLEPVQVKKKKRA